MSEFVGQTEAETLNLLINSMPDHEVVAGIKFQQDPLDDSRYIIPDGRRGVVSVSREDLVEIGRRKRFAEAYGGAYATRAAEVAAMLEQDAATRNGDWVTA